MEFTFSIDSDLKQLKNIEKSCRTLNKRHIRFGWYEGKNYPASSENRGLSIAQIAYWQEFGLAGDEDSPSIPSRPYFRQSINRIRRDSNKQIKYLFTASLHGRDPTNQLQKLADSFVTQYHSSVARQNYKSLAPYTISIKGHAYQMVDSGIMASNFKARVFRQSQQTIKD